MIVWEFVREWACRATVGLVYEAEERDGRCVNGLEVCRISYNNCQE